MDLFLSILAVSAGVASCLAAGLNAVASKGFTLKTPSGPDAMGIIIFFIFSLFGWVASLLGAIIAACRGGFAWLMTPPTAACIVLVPIVGALAFVSLLAMAGALDRNLKARTLLGWLGAFVLPIATNGFIGITALGDPAALARSPALRWAAVPLGMIALGSTVAAIAMGLAAQGRAARRAAARIAEREQQQEQWDRERQAQDASHRAALDALPDDAPLARFVEHLFIDKSEAHHALAMARIAELPDLAARFDRELMDPDPLSREYLLNYFRVAPSIDPALAAALTPAVARCFEHLAEDLPWLAQDSDHRAHKHARGMTLGLLKSAERFPARFTGPARVLRKAFDAWPNQDTRSAAQELLDRYLTNQALPD